MTVFQIQLFVICLIEFIYLKLKKKQKQDLDILKQNNTIQIKLEKNISGWTQFQFKLKHNVLQMMGPKMTNYFNGSF